MEDNRKWWKQKWPGVESIAQRGKGRKESIQLIVYFLSFTSRIFCISSVNKWESSWDVFCFLNICKGLKILRNRWTFHAFISQNEKLFLTTKNLKFFLFLLHTLSIYLFLISSEELQMTMGAKVLTPLKRYVRLVSL